VSYVFDSDALITLFKHYYPERFPSLWVKFDQLVSEKRILSVKEVFNEIKEREDLLSKWAKREKDLFQPPLNEELEFVTKMFQFPHFLVLVRKKQLLQGKPVADPFVIAKAAFVENGCVVTQEAKRKNAARIPNICEHFKINCMNLEEFMQQENWQF